MIALTICLGIMACIAAYAAWEWKRKAGQWERASAGFEKAHAYLREAAKLHRRNFQDLENKATAWKARCEAADAEVVELRIKLVTMNREAEQATTVRLAQARTHRDDDIRRAIGAMVDEMGLKIAWMSDPQLAPAWVTERDEES